MDDLLKKIYDEFCENSKREPFSFCREHEMRGFGFDPDTAKRIEAASAALESLGIRSGSWAALSAALSRAASEAPFSASAAAAWPHGSEHPITDTAAASPADTLSALTALEETPAKVAVAIAAALRLYVFPGASIHLGFNCDKYDRLNIFYEWDISDEYPQGRFTQYI